MHQDPDTTLSDVHPLRGPVELRTDADPDETAKRLAQAGRRGKLPGFVADNSRRFRVDCDAVPFEYAIHGEVSDAEATGSRVTLRAARRPMMPWIFAVTLVLTVWPGVWLTDSLLGVYWQRYAAWSESMPWLTYAWYLPITALPLPWLWRGLTRKSESMARESAAKVVAAVRAAI